MLEGGRVGALILIPAMIIVFGGTFAAAMTGTSIKSISTMVKMLILTLFPPKYNFKETIDDLVNYSTVARRDGLLALENQMESVNNHFLKKIMRFAIDGTEPEVLRSLAEMETNYIEERHLRSASVFQKMGGYSPTMGIIGTVMGLIATLAAAGDDPTKLIHHIASAFIATLWGVFMANIIWLPISDKLRYIHTEEHLYLEMVTEGVLSIQAGEVPSVVRAKLNGMLPGKEQEKLES